MSLTKERVNVHECSVCGAVDVGDGATCCSRQMDSIERVAVFQEPELEQIASQVFGISSNEFAVCKALMAEGPTTIADLSEQFDYDRSTVSRHLDHLAELGIVDKERQEVPSGGRQYVYSTIPPEEAHRTFLYGLYAWTEEALELTDELSDQKIEAIAENAVVAGDGIGDETTGKTQANGGRDDADSKVGSLIRRLFGQN